MKRQNRTAIRLMLYISLMMILGYALSGCAEKHLLKNKTRVYVCAESGKTIKFRPIDSLPPECDSCLIRTEIDPANDTIVLFAIYPSYEGAYPDDFIQIGYYVYCARHNITGARDQHLIRGWAQRKYFVFDKNDIPVRLTYLSYPKTRQARNPLNIFQTKQNPSVEIYYVNSDYGEKRVAVQEGEVIGIEGKNGLECSGVNCRHYIYDSGLINSIWDINFRK